MSDTVRDLIKRTRGLHQSIAESDPQLARGQVWCIECGATQKVDSAKALRYGWPKCCGATMTMNSPDERAALTARKRMAERGGADD